MGSANTKFELSADNWLKLEMDGLIVPVFKTPSPHEEAAASKGGKKTVTKGKKEYLALNDALQKLNQALQGMIQSTVEEEKYDGSKNKCLVFRKAPGDRIGARRVILVGLGEEGELSPLKLERAITAAMGSILCLDQPHQVAVLLPKACATDSGIKSVVDGIAQATYRSEEAKEKSPDLKKAILFLSKEPTSKEKSILQLAEVLANARSYGKDLVNKPSNIKTTNTLVEAAKVIGKKPGMTVKVEANLSWIEKNMPCFYTVAKGALASDPPKFITLSYKPKSGSAKKKIALVGKSVIFDTGGYQVKPGDGMLTMKGDMTGGAMVLGAMQALSELQPEHIEVHAYLAATPNKIDSDAMIPDSIVDTACGKKVEIRHTDAEGRLTLIDAVAKAAEAKPDEIISVATLTGAASIAVGRSIALMGRDEELINRINQAARSVGDPIQALEVTEEDYENIKSKLDGADIINTNQQRFRGSQTAAAFVMSGAPKSIPMAHMDIAGADMTADEKATGISQKTLIQYLVNENVQLGSAAGKPNASSGGKAAPKKRSK